MSNVKCEKCLSPFLYIKDVGGKTRVYCSQCGKWHRNLDKQIKTEILKLLLNKN